MNTIEDYIIVKNIQSPKLQSIDICAMDIYNFVRKYNKSFWVYITFFQRMFLLNNPLFLSYFFQDY